MGSTLKTSHSPLHFPKVRPKPLSRTSVTQVNFSANLPEQFTTSSIFASKVEFKTLEACKLGISRYPDFTYNAQGGRGTGTATPIDDENMAVTFDLETLYIPPLTSATTKFLGLPLPPFLRIDIVPELLQGIINHRSGKVELKFKAKFLFTAGNVYRPPPLLVSTLLTSDESEGKLRGGRGERMSREGMCKLVGVATVDAIDDFLMNAFLSLPTECLASLKASICFID